MTTTFTTAHCKFCSCFIAFGDTDIKHSYVVAATDGSVSLTCETTNFTNGQLFHWKFYRIGSTEAEAIILYNGFQVHSSHSRFNVLNPTPRTSVLSLRDVRLTDAGTYFCNAIADGIEGRYATLSLIVQGEMSINTQIAHIGTS